MRRSQPWEEKRVGKDCFRQMKLHRGLSQDRNGSGVFSILKQASVLGQLWTKQASDDGSLEILGPDKI